MQIEAFELAISCMAFVKQTEEVWVASGTKISRLSVRVSILPGIKFHSLTYCNIDEGYFNSND